MDVTVIMRVLVAVVDIVFLACVLRLVSQDKLLLKYSLLWVLLCLIVLVCDAFPGIMYWVADLIGFISPSNFIFLVAIGLLVAISLSLSVAVSRSIVANKNLTQRLAILERELERMTSD